MCKGVSSWVVGGTGDDERWTMDVDLRGVGMFPNQSSPDIFRDMLRDGDGEGGGPMWGIPGVGPGLEAAVVSVCAGCGVGCHPEVEGTGGHVVRGGTTDRGTVVGRAEGTVGTLGILLCE